LPQTKQPAKRAVANGSGERYRAAMKLVPRTPYLRATRSLFVPAKLSGRDFSSARS